MPENRAESDRVLRDVPLRTASRREGLLWEMRPPHAVRSDAPALSEARDTPLQAFFWINLAQRRALPS